MAVLQIISEQLEEKHTQNTGKPSSHNTVSVLNTIQSQTFSMTTPVRVMSFVRVKTPAQPPAICSVSFVLSGCLSGHVTERPDPPKSGSDCLHDCFPEGCEGVERGLG